MGNKQLTSNIKYCSLHGCYQISMVLMMGMSSVYLLSLGFTDTAIGIVLAVANLLAALLQPLFGNYLDAHRRASVPWFSIIVLALDIVLSLILYFTRQLHPLAALLFILIYALVSGILPLLNSVCFLLERSGVRVNFGLSRGIGSVSYAIAISVLGNVFARADAGLFPLFYAVSFALIAVVFFTLTNVKAADGAPLPQAEEEPLPLSGLMKAYPRYFIFLLGGLPVFTFLFASGNFFTIHIVKSIGGSTREMGYAAAIAAVCELPAMALAGRLMRKVPVHHILRISTAFFVLKFFLMITAKSIPGFYIAQAFQFFSYGFFFPCAVEYTARVFRKSDLVKGQSLLTTMNSVGCILAGLCGGVLLGVTSLEAMMRILFAAAALGAVIVWFSVRRVPEQPGA